MQELTDRQLMDIALVRYTAVGWQIVSQSESSFQIMLPHTVSEGAMALLVIAPIGLGIFVALGSIAFGSALLSLALTFAALLALEHLTKRPKLLYITATQLRTPAAIEHNAKGVAICSVCRNPTGQKDSVCRTCHAQFARA